MRDEREGERTSNRATIRVADALHRRIAVSLIGRLVLELWRV